MQRGGVLLQHGAQVGGVGSAVLVDHVAEHHYFARAENIGRRPVESAPVHGQPQVAFLLGRESANGRSVEGHVVPVLDEPLLVVIEHVQPAFEIAEQQRHGLDALLVRQVLEAFFLNLADRNALASAAPWRADSGLRARRKAVLESFAIQ